MIFSQQFYMLLFIPCKDSLPTSDLLKKRQLYFPRYINSDRNQLQLLQDIFRWKEQRSTKFSANSHKTTLSHWQKKRKQNNFLFQALPFLNTPYKEKKKPWRDLNKRIRKSSQNSFHCISTTKIISRKFVCSTISMASKICMKICTQPSQNKNTLRLNSLHQTSFKNKQAQIQLSKKQQLPFSRNYKRKIFL